MSKPISEGGDIDPQAVEEIDRIFNKGIEYDSTPSNDRIFKEVRTGSYSEIIAYLVELNQVEMAQAVLDLINRLNYKEGFIDGISRTTTNNTIRSN